MADDRKPSPDDSQDHGVLDDVGTSTTAIDLGATAQVSVTLPVGYRDDDSDDDVIADELSGEEAARASAIGEAPADDDSEQDHSTADDPSDDGPTDDEDDSAEDADEDDSSDADFVAEADADSDADTDTDADAAANAGDEPDATDEGAVGELVDDEDVVVDDEGVIVDDADADVVDPADAEHTAFPDEDAGTDQDESETETGVLSADEPAAETDDHRADTDGEHDVEPFEIADPVDDEPDDPASLTKAPADDARLAADTTDDEPDASTHAVAPTTKPRKETPVSQPDRPERVSFLRPPARRVDEVEDAAKRESSDVLTDERLLDTSAIRRPEPEDPWRRIVYAATGGLINLGDSKKTRARKALMARIAAPLPGAARFVPVMSRKGGVGKTTVTALLGMALADARNDRVVAIDANPDRGTLAERIAKVPGKTVRDLVRDRDQIHGYGDLSAHVVRDETRLDVLASDADPHVADAFSDADYRGVSELAQHFYSLVLTDTGTGIVHSVMDATLDLADQIVIVSGTSVDEARLASETLTWLETNSRGDLAKKAVVVINQEASGTELVRLDELESHFRTRARDVVRIPYDARIATGSTIAFHELAPATRQAARALAALVVEGIRAA